MKWAIAAIATGLVVAGTVATSHKPAPKPLGPWVEATGATTDQPASDVPRPLTSVHTEPATATAQPTAAPTLSPTGPPTEAPKPIQERSLLDSLNVTARPSGTSGYTRSQFGSSWRDIEGNGCDQRDDVLVRDALKGTVHVARLGSCDHDVLSGTWIDPYTGRRIELADAKDPHQAQRVQIDHVVPLAEAWESGASGWVMSRRVTYANDLLNLLAVDGPTNASKGADDPAAWRPRKNYQCAYAKRWIRTKARWDLAVDPSEVRALREMLEYC